MKQVCIYQINIKPDSPEKYIFRSFSFAMTHGFNLDDYQKVYCCVRDNDYNKDDAFVEFNLHHPSDFKGHSLSVSDIVELDGVKYYCDDIGWTKI